jgi:adenine-specific DNA-methyltransferase
MQIEHLNKETTDGTVRNLDALYQLFPSCFTEAQDAITGKMHRAVDWGKLRELLGEYVENDEPEKYDFTWVGKRAAQREAAAPCRKTLRPCPEESVNWDTTQNIYIEGDNLEVLKLLQNSYMGKVKMIYIDPPYNTGNDFVYHDDFEQSAEEYEESYYDDEGNRYYRNTDSNGRFHSDWCSMMYSRLLIARSLLSNDGAIFISIGEEEINNLLKISNEVFGESNKVGLVSRVAKTASNKGTFFAPSVDYIIVYAKDITLLPPFVGEVDESLYKKIEIEGENKGKKYRDDIALYQSALDPMRGCTNQRYYIEAPDGSLLLPPGSSFPPSLEDGSFVIPENHNDKVWRWSYPTYFQNKHLLVFKETKTSPLIDQNGNQAKYNIYTKSYLDERRSSGTLPRNLWDKFINRKGADLLKKMNIPFDFSKPVELIDYILQIFNIENNDIVLDFFSGSSTTAHAVIKRNSEDGIKRHFIMVQLPEKIDIENDSYKAGFKNICEIGKERIRRAGKKIKADSPLTTQDLDIGFRVLKCDESNYKPVAFAPKDYMQETLDMFLDNIKEERTGLDLLFDCMMRWGLELSLPYETQKVDGCTIYNVDDGSLVACFDGVVTSAVIDAIAETHPLRVVFRDSSFTEAAQKMNLFELFKQKCGWTDQEVQNNVRVI